MGQEEQSREQLVIDTFVGLADTLASDYELAELLHFLVERCGEVLGADTAGVLVETPDGDLRLTAALSEEMHDIEEASSPPVRVPASRPTTAAHRSSCPTWPSARSDGRR